MKITAAAAAAAVFKRCPRHLWLQRTRLSSVPVGTAARRRPRVLTGAYPPSTPSSLMAAARAVAAKAPTVSLRRTATAAAELQSATIGRSATGLRRAGTTAGRDVFRQGYPGKL